MGIRDRILARDDLRDARARRDLDALAAGLNAQPPLAAQSRYVTMRTVVAECDDANGIITALTSAAALIPVVAEMLRFLRADSGMDVGHAKTQAQLDAMAVAGVLTAAQAQALKDLALQPEMVTREQVAAEMYNLDGTEQ